MSEDEDGGGGNNKWIGACCVLILIIAGVAFLSGGGSDTNKNSDSFPRLNATSENGAHFYYYGEDTPAGKSGYTYAVVINGTPYYMDDKNAELLAQSDNSMLAVMKYDLNKYDSRYSPKNYVIGSSGVNFVYEGKSSSDTTMFEYKLMKDFQFSYRENVTIGENKNAHMVEHVYDLNGSEIKKK